MTRGLLTVAAILTVGCKFDEPPPSREVYFAAVADVPPRPKDALAAFRRPPLAAVDAPAAPDPRCLGTPAPGSHETLRRANTTLLCAPVTGGPSGLFPAAAALIATTPPGAIPPDAGLRVAVDAHGPSRVCAPVHVAAGAPRLPGAVTLTSVPVTREWVREPYPALVTRAAKGAPDAASGRTVWVLLPCDPGGDPHRALAGAIERDAR